MINTKFKACCGKNVDGRLKSISISETGIPTKALYSPTSNPTENIVSALKLLKDKAPSKKTVHFLIDEFNSEILCKKYSTKLADGLKTHFKDSTVVFALQSVRKDRSIRSSDKQKNFQTEEINMEPLKKAEVKEFVLTSSVRMSSQLHQMQSHLEAETEKFQLKAPLTFKDSIDNGW